MKVREKDEGHGEKMRYLLQDIVEVIKGPRLTDMAGYG
jgi:hypothetical protein